MDQALEAGSGYVDEYKAAFDVLPPLTSLQMQKVSDLKDGKVNFPARASDSLVGKGVHLRPQESSLGPAGQLACPAQPRASGVWRGVLEGQTPSAAANRAAPVLLGVVALDVCGVLANTALSGSSLHFLPGALLEEAERQRRLAAAKELSRGDIQAHVKVFKLAGRVGQVLSHSAELFLYGDDAGTFEAILRLQPLIHVTREAHFQVAREGPLGAIHEVWSEVAMVELPRLFQLSITHATSAVGIPKQQFLVEEEDEILVINAWQRDEDEISKSLTAISLEQLLWCETLRALAETPPCAEEAVPAARLSLADEGVTTYEELLDSPNEEGAGVPREDAPRLASLAFLRQYVNRPVLEEELLPRLLPNQRGVVRVFSAQLDEHEGTSPLKGLRPPKPKTLDDLFSENPDFRKPSHYATGIDENDPDRGDPLIPYDLTSVLLLCETSGFLLAFHCLQAKDPST